MADERLRVAIDATSLLEPATGVGRFTQALLRGLAARADERTTAFAVTVRGRSRLRSTVPEGVRVTGPPLPARLLHASWSRWSRPRLDVVLGRQDVVHGPNFVVPPTRAARVATVHDLTAVRYPDLVRDATLRYPSMIRRAAAEGAWIHTVSHAVRDEVVAELGIDPDRVVAVPNGFDPVQGDAERGRRLAGGGPYVLAVGTVEPRKDLPSVVAAVDRLADEHRDLTLVHAGADGWGVDALERAVRAMAHPDRFRRLGRVSSADLADLYAGARVLAYPSVYEGFGLPVLEAMSAGVPVVTTDVAAVAEVAGDAAARVPVGDVDALADALARAWTDDEWRSTTVERGFERCARYPWETCVDGLVDLYHRAVDAASRGSG